MPKPRKSKKTTGKHVCIVCHKARTGERVYDDVFISTMRSLKRTLGLSTNNILVVCKDCVPVHRKRRSTFEKKVLQYGAFGLVLGAILLFISRSLQGLLMALLMVLFMAILAMITYHPASKVSKG